MGFKTALRDTAYGRDRDDRTDAKWAHPELAEWWRYGIASVIGDYCNEDIPLEERRRMLAERTENTIAYYQERGYFPFEGRDSKPASDGYGVLREYHAKGCPEASDDDVRLWVLEPNEKSDTPRPVLLYIMYGAMFTHHPGIYTDIMRWGARFNCVVVVPDYRTPFDAKYPGQINDIHAAYLWMLENAEMLGIDPDNVTLFGESTGSHFALCTAFRLKRYGITPRGCVVNDAMVDDRNFFESSKIIREKCDSARMHAMYLAYVGADNVASPYLGPEAFANHATVEECKGLCPIFLNIGESDQERDATMDFARKLYEARVPCSLHVWEGSAHASMLFARKNPTAQAFWDNLFNDIRCCMTYDMRRPWAWDKE